MNHLAVLEKISPRYQAILGKNLIGIYVHGSIAFGCFNAKKSDIDFLVVLEKDAHLEQKISLIQTLLDLKDEAPKKGFEMSVVLKKDCQNFSYPTPYTLHFSNDHLDKCTNQIASYCKEMNGTDKDLAAHFTVIKSVGLCLYGEAISSVFQDVPKSAYLDSIKCDVEHAKIDIFDNPVYVILNLCRVLGFLKEGKILSKEQGGEWGLEKIDKAHYRLIKQALFCYQTDEIFPQKEQEEALKIFASSMIDEIFKK